MDKRFRKRTPTLPGKGDLPILDENMLRMQQEAAERVRKMQERARKFVDDEPVSINRNPPHILHEHPQPAVALPVEEDPPKPILHKKDTLSFLSGFGNDREQLFLLLIAVLLVKNDAPIELILALLYIAL